MIPYCFVHGAKVIGETFGDPDDMGRSTVHGTKFIVLGEYTISPPLEDQWWKCLPINLIG